VTERLYYHDPYLREFDASIVETVVHEGRTGVVLDRTAFYPSSGGQPFDVGTLGGASVVDVVDLEDGRILHVVEAPPAGDRITGCIDWARRFDHMQQHTGQHVLSAAFDRFFRVRTESFHLGADYSTIDLAREVSATEIARAEDEANRVVWEDRPVIVRFADAEEVARLPLRKEPKREGLLRLIEVQEFDLSACGGTHVARTGAIGIIAIASVERLRGGSRLTFLCGQRALAGYRVLRDAVSGSVRALSVLPGELPAAIERVQAESKELRRQLKAFQEQLAGHQAAALAGAATPAGDARIVTARLPGWDATGLKIIASRIVEQPGFVVVLVSEPQPSALVVARSAGLAYDAGALLRQLTSRHGGKGGGRPELAQGGGIMSPAADVLVSARDLLEPGAPE
jgi:alanyl-tRNA synthetase